VLKGNSTSHNSSEIHLCGVHDCPKPVNENSTGVEKNLLYTLCGIYISLTIAAVILILIFLDSREKIGIVNCKELKSSTNLMINTIKHMKNINQLFLLPLTLYAGFEQAFLGANFTKSFVNCIMGIENVGLVMLCYGIADTIGSYLFGYIIKYTGRVAVFLTAALLNYSTILLMIFWEPNDKSYYVVFLIAILWGLADAVWQSQVTAFYGVIFKSEEEAAFSNRMLWESVGFAIGYAYADHICVSTILYLLIVYLTLSLIGYGLIEYREKRKQASKIEPTD